MRIKTWLLISFLVVMILPLVSAYVLFAWVMSYNNDQKVTEYYEVFTDIQSLNNSLRDPELYRAKLEETYIDTLIPEDYIVHLYNKDGKLLYNSAGELKNRFIDKESLFTNLYDLEQGFRFYTYKEPVFDGTDLIGVFTVQTERKQLLHTITKRAWIVTISFISSFALIYIIIALIVNQRINLRLDGLMDEMAAFASGKELTEETPTGKDEIGELKQHFYDMRKQINNAREVIDKEQKAKEHMVATISHDLKTPLTSIKAYAESLGTNEDLSIEDEEQYRQVIIDKANYMKQMINDLNTHTLLQSEAYEMDVVTVDGNEFFEMLLSGYEPLCTKKSLNLSVQQAVSGQFDVNPKQFIRVVDNLMTNAIYHTPIKGNIWLMALSENINLPWLFSFVSEQFHFDFEHNAYVIVQNEGKGISKDHMTYLFDPLYQVDVARTKREAHGSGLGLTITKQIVEKHGGTVHVFSKQNIGACFICSIPKREEKQ